MHVSYKIDASLTFKNNRKPIKNTYNPFILNQNAQGFFAKSSKDLLYLKAYKKTRKSIKQPKTNNVFALKKQITDNR